MTLRKNSRVSLLCCGALLLASCTGIPDEHGRLLSELNRSENIDVHEFADRIVIEDPTYRIDILGSLLTTRHPANYRLVLNELRSKSARTGDKILAGDLEFTRSEYQYQLFELALAGKKPGDLTNDDFEKEQSERMAALQRARENYLAAGDYLGVSFVDATLADEYTTNRKDYCDKLCSALNYYYKGKRNPKRKVINSGMIGLVLGSYEGELRSKLKESQCDCEGQAKGTSKR